MSVARAARLEAAAGIRPGSEQSRPHRRGGVAGMNCALSIQTRDTLVHLVEKRKGARGNSQEDPFHLEGLDVQAYLRDLTQKVYKHPLVHVYMMPQSQMLPAMLAICDDYRKV
jgi:heterodisulfide reductase subunit A